jgi:hypothetical protein
MYITEGSHESCIYIDCSRYKGRPNLRDGCEAVHCTSLRKLDVSLEL